MHIYKHIYVCMYLFIYLIYQYINIVYTFGLECKKQYIGNIVLVFVIIALYGIYIGVSNRGLNFFLQLAKKYYFLASG